MKPASSKRSLAFVLAIAVASPLLLGGQKFPPMDYGFPIIQVDVTTGDDDLRDDSEAWLTLTYDVYHRDTCYLKHTTDRGFPAHSTRSFRCRIGGGGDVSRTLLAGANVKLEFRSHNHFPETDDAWAVAQIKVNAITLAVPPRPGMCLYDMRGSPWYVLLRPGFPTADLRSGTNFCRI